MSRNGARNRRWNQTPLQYAMMSRKVARASYQMQSKHSIELNMSNLGNVQIVARVN